MFKRTLFIIALALALTDPGHAQNTNSSTTRKRTATTTNSAPATPAAQDQDDAAQTPAPKTNTPRTPKKQTTQGAAKDPNERNVRAAFDNLLDGIRKANVKEVMDVYWNSPQLLLFNNNGTVTRGWEQVRKNRESSYPEMKDVILDVRDVRVQMLGAGGAVVTCLWTQSQTFRGEPETASGRMTLVFRRVGTSWKATHLHTSPDAPDPSRILPSEQQTTPPASGSALRPA